MSDNLAVVARLTLNAQDFSSETGRAFAQMRERVQQAAASVKTEFLSSFTEVQKNLRQSLALPRQAGGGLDLSVEIGQLRASAEAQDLRTQAYRAYTLAAESAAGGGAQLSKAALLEADAARLSALASEQDAAALRQRIGLLETIQGELSRTAVAETAEASAAMQAARACEEQAQARRDATFAYSQFERVARDKMTAYREQLAQTEAAERAALAISEQVAAARAEVQGRRFADAFTPVGSGKSARESAAVYEELARAEREAEQAAAGLASRVDRLRASLDPAAAAQRRLDVELGEARQLAQQGAIGFDEYLLALRRYDGALTTTAVSHRQFAGSAGQQRNSMIQLGQQFQDFAVQVGSGQSVAVAFAQQIGQAGFAIQGMGGKLTGVAAFLTSGWGIAATVGVVALTPLVAKIFESNDALGKAVEKLREEARQSDVTRQAKERFKTTEEGVTAAIRDGIQATKDSIAALDSEAARANIQAKNNLEHELQLRRTTKALIEQNTARLDALRLASEDTSQDPVALAETRSRYENRGQQFQVDLANNDSKIAAAEQRIQQTRVDLANEASQQQATAVGRVTKQYDDQINAVLRLEAAQAKAGKHIDASLTNQLTLLRQQKAAKIEATQAADRRAPKPTLGAQITADRGAALLSSAQGYSGLTEAGAGRSELTALFASANQRVDPKMTAWCAAFVNAVLATNNLPGTGSLSANSFLNYGTKTNKPQAGDVVVLRTGRSQEHVGFYAGERNGRVLVTGGNQSGGQVSTTSFARSAVEAFRRAPDAASTARDAAHDAAAEQRQLKQDIEALTGAFDPAAAAALEYAKALAEIHRLGAAGGLSLQQEIDYASAARRKMVAASTQPLPEHPFGDDLLPGLRGLENEHASRAANDNRTSDIAAAQNEQREQGAETLRYLSGLYGDLFNGQTGNIMENLKRLGSDAAGNFIAKEVQRAISQIHLPKGLTDLLKGNTLGEGAGYGSIGGSVFASITGGKNNAVASQVGGVLGDVAGKALGKIAAKEIGGALGKSLGGAAGPIGSIVGGILGNVVGGLFAKKQNSGAGISTAGGVFDAGAAIGTSAGLKGQASSLAGSVSGGLQKIADALGASITGSTDVRIGTSNGNFHVNTHGGQIGQKGSGDVNFGTDQEAAVRAAIADALTDGVLSGISEAAQRILKSGQDIDRAVSKALAIESIPKALKAMLDPVGAALDDLNRKWKTTVDALKEGGASAEQFADAEKLYKLQLDQVKASTASASQGLKDFLLSLKVGSASPLSLRDQEAAARTALQPYLDTIAGGGNVDQAKYQGAAQSFLDIERQLYGSTQAFFDQFGALQDATNKAISNIDNAVPITPAVESPFVKATADSTAETAGNTATGNELLAQVSDQIAQATALLQGILGNTGASGTTGFIGGGRGFTTAQAA